MTLFGIRIRFHILSPIVILLTLAFSGAQTVIPPLAALSVHEFSHLLCAVIVRAKIDEIELMPFGAAIRLYGLWEISPIKLMAISLSGPIGNLLFAFALSFVLFLFPNLAQSITPHLYAGIAVALINLIPALPLDGGRFLSALLALKIKRSHAVRIGIYAGYALSFFLIASSLYVYLKTRVVPLSALLASVYLIASSDQEKRASEGANLRAALLKKTPPPPVRRASLILAEKNARVIDALSSVRPGEDSLFAVCDSEGEVLTLLPLNRMLSKNCIAGSTMDQYLFNSSGKKQ